MASRDLEKTGETVRDKEIIYKAVVQTVILHGSKSWVITGEKMKVLEEFHHQILRRLTGNTDRYVREEGWKWPPSEEDIEVAGLWKIQEYVRRRQVKIADHIMTPPIFELCTRVERISGTSRSLRWWDQDHTWEGRNRDNKMEESEV